MFLLPTIGERVRRIQNSPKQFFLTQLHST